MEFKTFAIRKNSSCPLCNEEPRIQELNDYQEVCELESVRQATI
jgi:hypothetical protein